MYVTKQMKPLNISVPGCKVLANSEYVLKHNRALMIMRVAWVKEYGLVGGELV